MTAQLRAGDDYSEKLIKLLPAEGIAALTSIKTLLGVSSKTENLLWGCAFVVGVFVLVWARQFRKVESYRQLVFILVAYILWTLNILWDLASAFPIFNNAPQALPAVCSILFALFIPLVFPAPPAAP